MTAPRSPYHIGPADAAGDATFFMVSIRGTESELMVPEEVGYDLKRILREKSENPWVFFTTLDGDEMMIRRDAIQALYLSTPDSRAWYKAYRKASKDVTDD